VKPLRITIDAVSALVRSAGVKNYTYHWLRHLRRHAAGNEQIRAFPLLGRWESLDHESSARSRWATWPRLAALYGVNCFGPVALDLVLGGLDVFHASNQVHCAPRRAKLTATVHDLTALLMPELHTPGNVAADRYFTQHILRRADALIAVSENTRQDAIRMLGIAPERITTIYSGVAPEYFEAVATRRERPYALYVGTIEPRKNLETLLDAWTQLKPGLRREYDLVVAGPMGWASEAAIERIRRAATYLGYVPEAELPGLTAGASVFVYPSLYEGFGFPVVQAMAAGTPVVTSNTSCLPEIAGDAAVLVDPRSPAEIGSALARVLESASLRAELSARGRERARRYNWDTCAEESLRFFRKVAG
jgi:glycosyltransferase involved in cell wall biosynthesis